MINLLTGLIIGLTLFVFYWFTHGIGVVAVGVAMILILTGVALGWFCYMSFDHWYWGRK